MEIVLSAQTESSLKICRRFGFRIFREEWGASVALTVLLPNFLFVHLIMLAKLAALAGKLSKSIFLFPDFVVVITAKNRLPGSVCRHKYFMLSIFIYEISPKRVMIDISGEEKRLKRHY